MIPPPPHSVLVETFGNILKSQSTKPKEPDAANAQCRILWGNREQNILKAVHEGTVFTHQDHWRALKGFVPLGGNFNLAVSVHETKSLTESTIPQCTFTPSHN
jgi:hypothetical protein